MEYVAISKSVRVSPRKARLIAKGLRQGASVISVLDRLALVTKRAGGPIEKTIKSALANAIHNGKADKEVLIIKSIDVMEGTPFKRFRPSTRGRIHPYKKRSSHIRVVLTDNESQMSNVKSQMQE